VLSPIENMFILLDTPARKQIIYGLIEVHGEMSRTQFHYTAQKLLRVAPRLSHSVFSVSVPLFSNLHYFHPSTNINLDQHLFITQIDTSADEDEIDQKIKKQLSQIMDKPLALKLPLWELHMLHIRQPVQHNSKVFQHHNQNHDHSEELSDMEVKKTVLLLKIHHSLSDGVSMNVVLAALATCSDGSSLSLSVALPRSKENSRPEPGIPSSLSTHRMKVSKSSGFTLFLVVFSSLVKVVRYVLRVGSTNLDFKKGFLSYYQSTSSLQPTSLDSLSQKQVAWSTGVQLEDVKLIKDTFGVTINDVLCACIAGAFRSLLVKYDRATHDLLAMIPVSLHGVPKTQTINNDGNSFLQVNLQNSVAGLWLFMPSHVEDRMERMRIIASRMVELKSQPELLAWPAFLLGFVGYLPPFLIRFAINRYLDRAICIFTNLPGPQEPIFISGMKVSKCCAFGLQSSAGGLGVAVISYHGQVNLTIVADHYGERSDIAQFLVDAFTEEVNEFIKLTRLEKMEKTTIKE